MSSDPEGDARSIHLSDEAVQRLLARASQLDASRQSRTSLATLREAARDAGISTEAFDQAVRESQDEYGAHARSLPRLTVLKSPRPSIWGRLLDRIRGRVAADATQMAGDDSRGERSSLGESIVINVAALVLFSIIYGAVNRTTYGAGLPWEIRHAAQVLVDLLAVGAAVRVKARVAAHALGALFIFQSVKLVIHLAFGLEAAQGGPNQLAILSAAGLGVGLGAFLARNGEASRTQSGQTDTVSAIPEEPAAPRADAPPEPRLRLGLT